MHAPRLRLERDATPAAVYAAVGLSLLAVYAFTASQVVHQTIYHLLGCAVPVALLYGVRRFRPARKLPWLLLAAGTAGGAAADFIWDAYGWLGESTPFPSAADPLYLFGELLVIAGLVVIVRSASAGVERWLIDSLIFALPGGILMFVLWIAPLLDEQTPVLERALAAAYPSLDILLLLVVLPLLFSRSRNTTLRCVALYGAATLVADVVYGIQSLNGTYVEGGWLDLFWLAAFVSLAAGAANPALRVAELPVERPWDDWVRLGLLALSTIAVLVVVAAESPSWDDAFVVVAIGAGAAISLVLVRAGLIYAALRGTAARLRGETERLCAMENVQRFVTSGEGGLDRLLHVACSETAAVTHGAVSIALVDGERLVVRGAVGSEHVVVGREMAPTSVARVALERDEVVTYGDLELADVGDHELAQHTGARAIVAAPLHFAGSPIGAIIATHPAPYGLGAEVERTLEMMSSLVSVAVNRSSEFTARRALAEIVDSSEDAIIGQSLTGAIVSWSAGAERMLGYTSGETVGRSIDLIVPEELRSQLAARRGRIAHGFPVAPFETERLAKDGRRVPVSLGLYPIHDDSGKVVGISAISRDMTPQKALEDQLHQSQKLEAVGQLAGGIAHDFNNLLLAIQGYGTLLRERVLEDETSTHYAEHVLTAARRSAELTQQLLAYSRKQVLHPSVTSLNEVVSETSRMLERVIGEDIVLSCELDPDAGDVLVDGGRLAQVVMNLGVNARDAMPNGGRLSLATGRVDVDGSDAGAMPPGTYAWLTVADTGTGMDEETRRSIFEPFFTTKEEGKGTGLGLATVHGTVTQSGGYITVDSAPGHGTVFAIYFPEHVIEATDEVEPGELRDEDPSGARVLLVEDQAVVRAVVGELLEGFGYSVVAADGADSALAACDNQSFDLLLTDIVMPGMSGVDLAARVHSTQPERASCSRPATRTGASTATRGMPFSRSPIPPQSCRPPCATCWPAH